MTDFRERVKTATKVEFTNCLANGDFEIVHNVNVHEALGHGGTVDYRDDSQEVSIKSAKLSKKKDGKGGFRYVLKITIATE